MLTRKEWVEYLRQHSQVQTRVVHRSATAMAVIGVLTALYQHDYVLGLVSVGLGYLIAWLSHLIIEHNLPATFKHPLKSLVADFRMLLTTEAEIRRSLR